MFWNGKLGYAILSASALVCCSCSNSNLDSSISFSQDELHLEVNQDVDVSELVNYSNLVGSITYAIEDDSIISIDGSVIHALKSGISNVYASINENKDSLKVIVDEEKPHIYYQYENYEFDRLEGAFDLFDYINVSPQSSLLSLTSLRDDYVFDGEEIRFDGVGNYVFSLVASNNGASSDAYNFVIYVYDSLTLSGKGTLEDPFLVSSASDLKKISDAILKYKDLKDRYFLQTNNIDISEYSNWTPIGTFGIPFEGTYNGNNFEVSGLKIETSESWQGLFGFSSGVIKNLTVRGDVKVTCNSDYVYSHSFCGGVCGGLYNAAVIDNCTNYVNVHGDSYVGGLVGGIARSDEMIVGRNQSMIINCKNYGTITGDDTYAYNEQAMYFGGICGESLGILTGNINYGKVEISGSKTRYVGGVCGLGYIVYKYGMYYDEDLEKYANNDNINYGEVSGYHSVGGVFGGNVLPSHNCINYGKVSGNVCVGGVSGLNGTAAVLENNYSVSLLENCKNFGEIYAENRYAGGIVSYSYYDVKNCLNDGKVTGGDAVYGVGGVVGYQSSGTVIDCINDENSIINGSSRIGGLIGINTGRVKNSINNATVSGNTQYIGGIVGVNGDSALIGIIDACVNNGDVLSTSTTSLSDKNGNCVGGIAGFSYSVDGTKIANCFNFGEITSISATGGIAGFIKTGGNATLDNLYNFGDVIGHIGTDGDTLCGHVGGVVGMLGSGLTLNKAVNTGRVQGNGGRVTNKWRGVGGIVGSFYSGTISYAYNFGNVAAKMHAGGIVGYSQGNSSKSITNCISGGSISDENNNAGGILGRGNYTSISDSISFASVTTSGEQALIYGAGNSITLTNNSKYPGSNSATGLIKNIYLAKGIVDKVEAQEMLDDIDALLSSKNSVDDAILTLTSYEDKTFEDLLDETVEYLNEIIGGSSL